MPQREFYAKYVDNSSYTSLVNGGSGTCSLAFSDSEKLMTTLIFNASNDSTLPDNATINSITLNFDCKLDKSTTAVGVKFRRVYDDINYTVNGSVFSTTDALNYGQSPLFLVSESDGADTEGKFRWTSMTAAHVPNVHEGYVMSTSLLKKDWIFLLWAFKNKSTLANTLTIRNIRLVVDYIRSGCYLARISGVGMSNTDEVYIKQNPSWSVNEGLDYQFEQSTPAYYCAKATNDKIITKIECKDLDGTLWTKDAAQLKAEGALNANQTELTYESTSSKHTEHEIIVHFESPQSVVVTTSAVPEGCGTTTGDGTYEFGTSYQVTATAKPGCTISKVNMYSNNTLIMTLTAEEMEQQTSVFDIDDEHKNVTITGNVNSGNAGSQLHCEFIFDGSPGSNVYLGTQLVDVYVGTTLVDVYVGTTLI